MPGELVQPYLICVELRVKPARHTNQCSRNATHRERRFELCAAIARNSLVGKERIPRGTCSWTGGRCPKSPGPTILCARGIRSLSRLAHRPYHQGVSRPSQDEEMEETRSGYSYPVKLPRAYWHVFDSPNPSGIRRTASPARQEPDEQAPFDVL